jgi:hypothetical protein
MAIYRIIFQRAPRPDEIRLGYGFVKKEDGEQDETAAAMSAKLNPKKQVNAPRRGMRNDDRFGPIKNPGERVERTLLTPWETYVHALLFSNEAAYLN